MANESRSLLRDYLFKEPIKKRIHGKSYDKGKNYTHLLFCPALAVAPFLLCPCFAPVPKPLLPRPCFYPAPTLEDLTGDKEVEKYY